MWRARLAIYCIVIIVAGASGLLHSLADPQLRSVLGMAMNLAALPVVEIVLTFLRREAEAAARRAARDPRVREAQQRGSPPAPGPLR